MNRSEQNRKEGRSNSGRSQEDRSFQQDSRQQVGRQQDWQQSRQQNVQQSRQPSRLGNRQDDGPREGQHESWQSNSRQQGYGQDEIGYRDSSLNRESAWASQGPRSGYGVSPDQSSERSNSFENNDYRRPSTLTSSDQDSLSSYSSNRTARNFSGIGPKGYRRSDDRIEEEVNNVLMRSPNIDASEIEVAVKDGNVTLSGTVDNRHARVEAELSVERISGVNDIQNEIRIKKNSGYSERRSETRNDSSCYS